MPEYSETADGTLVIMVCRAKHLPNRRKLDKQSPYVLLRINTTAKKTPSHFRAGQTPEWTHEIRFKLDRERKPIMRLDVLDETKTDPTPIGGTEIDCLQVFLDPANRQAGGKYIWDSWHELTFRDRPAGKIYLEMTFYPSAPVLPPKVGLSPEIGRHSIAQEDDDMVSEFRHLAPNPQHLPIADDVFVNAETKKSHFFRRSDPERPTGGLTQVVFPTEPRKETTFDKLKNKFRAKEPFSAIWTSDSNLKSSIVQELPLYGKDALSITPLPAVTLQDIDSGVPPVPPPHSEYSLISLHASPEIPHYERLSPKREHLPSLPPPPPPKSGLSSPKRSPQGSPGRKPPPGFADTAKLKTTEIPFSAESFGMDDDDDTHLPTTVYHMGQQIKSLTIASTNKTEPSKDDIDPRHYAPTPSEHLAKNLRLQNGQVKFEDIQVDLKTEQTGYLGEGKWDTKRFSPNIFDRIHDEQVVKPNVPPKIPNGLSEREYYVLEKENYLKDLNSRRI